MTKLTNQCYFEGCEREVYGRGLCNAHWQQKHKRNQVLRPLNGPRMYGVKTLEERFWAFVDKKSDDECWGWKGAVSEGYGKMGTGTKKWDLAHRISYRLHTGREIPKTHYIDHKCGTRHCTNPNHLHLVTMMENSQRLSVRHDNNTGYRGVQYQEKTGKYRARVNSSVNGYFDRTFTDLQEAVEWVKLIRLTVFTNSGDDDKP